jgi:peptidoglycan/LPS O-acetylase OafA/YrhL
VAADRLRSLDGLRGVAVLSVMGFHYFYYNPLPNRDTTLAPFGDAMLSFPLFKYGYLGVYLFFVISGFVIALTLERCQTPGEFVIRRFARIWPALFVCSILTYSVIGLSHSPYSLGKAQSLVNFLPSLTLTPIAMWRWAGTNVDMVDGVYWTLLVEARFYMIALGVFLLLPRIGFSQKLVAFTLANILCRAALQRMLPGSNVYYGEVLVPDFMPWFAAGAVFYDLYRERLPNWLAAIMLAAMYAITVRTSMFATDERPALTTGAIGLAIFLAFWLVAKRRQLRIFEADWIVNVGRWSYSIYLLHFSIGMCIMSLLPKNYGIVFGIVAVLLTAGLSICLGALSFKLVETPCSNWIHGIAHHCLLRRDIFNHALSSAPPSTPPR